MPKVLLIGWDGAAWKHIHPILDEGGMPNLARLVETGVMGELSPLRPLCSPLLWTTISTGQFADAHGVLDAAEPDPVTGGIRPVTRRSLAAIHLADFLAQQGVASQSINWPATHPAQGLATCVSNGFVQGAPNSIYPAELVSKLTALRFNPQEFSGAELKLFVPGLASIDQDRDNRLAQLAVILAQAVSTQAAATALLETGGHDFTAVWFGTISQALELFPSDSADIYKDVVSGVYRFLDLLLGRLLTLAGPEATAIVVSDRAADEAGWNASLTGRASRGILCATGPYIAHDELAFGAGLLDIAPTILRLFGFPAPPHMRGRVVTEICAQPPLRTLIDVPANARAASLANAPSVDMDGGLQELENLGYRDSVAAAKQTETGAARLRRDFHLAQVLLAQGHIADAIPLLERIVQEDPARLDFRLHLAHAYRVDERFTACRAQCEILLKDYPDSPLAPLAWANIAISEGNYKEARKWLKAARGNYGLAAVLDVAIGQDWLRTKNWQDAAAAFRSAILADDSMPAAHEGLAFALLHAGQFADAAGAALDAIRLRYDLPDAHGILAAALRGLGRVTAADNAALISENLRRGRHVA